MYVLCIISASAGSVRKRPKASCSTEIKGLEFVDTSTTRRTDPFRGSSFQRADWRAANQSDAFSVGELYNVGKKSSIFERLLPKTLFFELKVFKKCKNTPHGSFQRADWSGGQSGSWPIQLSFGRRTL